MGHAGNAPHGEPYSLLRGVYPSPVFTTIFVFIYPYVSQTQVKIILSPRRFRLEGAATRPGVAKV